MEKVIELNIRNYKNLSKTKKEWWIWLIAGLFILSGLALSIVSIVLLSISYTGDSPLAAFAGAIGGGLTLALAGLTQILVFIHRKQDEKAKKLNKAEHDYTNFFIKNYHWNDIISLVLQVVNERLGIKLEFESKKVKVLFDDSIVDFKNLRKLFISNLSSELYKNALASGMLKKAYNLETGTNLSSDVFNIFSAFDTEIKKSAMSVEKILQAKSNSLYEKDFYDFNMKERLKSFALTIMPYFLIAIHDNQNYIFSATAVDLLPFMIYYLSAKED